MKNSVLIIVTIIFLVTAGWGVWNFYMAVNGTPNVNAPVAVINKNTNQPAVSPALPEEPADNDYIPNDYTDDKIVNTTPLITLSSPVDNTHVLSPIEIKGQAKNGISKVNIRVTNLAGAPLINLTADVKFLKASSAWGDFKAKVAYEFSQTKEGYLEVYSENASGDKENLVKLHLYFD